MKSFFRRRLIDPLLAFLKQGVSPEKLALAITLGIISAVVPVFGAATLLCLIPIKVFRLNPGAILLVNQVAYPLQFLLYIPLIKSGQWLFNDHSLTLTISMVFSMFREDAMHAIGLLWNVTMYALVVWVIASLLVGTCLYWALKALLQKAAIRMQTVNH
ncbi:MAG: DUF2062 domain-containing protein [Chryseolinea sp.]